MRLRPNRGFTLGIVLQRRNPKICARISSSHPTRAPHFRDADFHSGDAVIHQPRPRGRGRHREVRRPAGPFLFEESLTLPS
jgi:hypothetical protein